eukprot:scaffold803_cov310-Pinguiococcus_pyrenoidosus.AAC.150
MSQQPDRSRSLPEYPVLILGEGLEDVAELLEVVGEDVFVLLDDHRNLLLNAPERFGHATLRPRLLVERFLGPLGDLLRGLVVVCRNLDAQGRARSPVRLGKIRCGGILPLGVLGGLLAPHSLQPVLNTVQLLIGRLQATHRVVKRLYYRGSLRVEACAALLLKLLQLAKAGKQLFDPLVVQSMLLTGVHQVDVHRGPPRVDGAVFSAGIGHLHGLVKAFPEAPIVVSNLHVEPVQSGRIFLPAFRSLVQRL